ncbi:hypothetical protein I3843_Q011400 [Carya illinoinensis]|nr:hypothetical protein I3843_Q011400 [Carya illinoinensis]
MAESKPVVSKVELPSKKGVIRIEVGETSQGRDQPVISVDREAQTQSGSSREERVKKFKEENQVRTSERTKTPKIQKVIFLRRDHEHFVKYYEPRVVSLGPIHHGKEKYQLAETFKSQLANEFVKNSEKTIEEICQVVDGKIKVLRECFEEEVTKKYNDVDLAWILVVDGCVILQYIDLAIKDKFKDLDIKHDIVAFCQQDLFLLENQVPYRLLELLMSSSPKPVGDGASKRNSQRSSDWQSRRTVQELKAAGIHVKRSEGNSLRNISFRRNLINCVQGVLSLPPLIVDDSTGPKFLNLIAYEMCLDFDNDFGITSYVSFVDSLIENTNDVKELRKAHVFFNLLGSDEEVAKLFNEIGTDLVPDLDEHKYVRTQIQKYYDNKIMVWMAELFHDIFSRPWKVVAFFGSLSPLVLIATQTLHSPSGPHAITSARNSLEAYEIARGRRFFLIMKELSLQLKAARSSRSRPHHH